MKFRLNLIGTSRNLNQIPSVLFIYLRRLVYDGFEIGHEPELSRRRSHIVSPRWVLVVDQNRSRGLYNKSQNEKTRLWVGFFLPFKWWGWVGGEWWWMRTKGLESENRLAEIWQRRKESKPTMCVSLSLPVKFYSFWVELAVGSAPSFCAPWFWVLVGNASSFGGKRNFFWGLSTQFAVFGPESFGLGYLLSIPNSEFDSILDNSWIQILS